MCVCMMLVGKSEIQSIKNHRSMLMDLIVIGIAALMSLFEDDGGGGGMYNAVKIFVVLLA